MMSEAAMARLLDDHVSRLDDDLRSDWERHGLRRPVPILCVRGYVFENSECPPEPIYCVARIGLRVLIYDDVEEEFGTGVLDGDGLLREWGTYGDELNWSFRPFMERN
jgi:hypothetical protein